MISSQPTVDGDCEICGAHDVSVIHGENICQPCMESDDYVGAALTQIMADLACGQSLLKQGVNLGVIKCTEESDRLMLILGSLESAYQCLTMIADGKCDAKTYHKILNT